MNALHRRTFLKQAGLSAATLPFITGLPSLGLAAPARPRQRLVFMFSPNGTIPAAYWPDAAGTDFQLKEIMTPLAAFKDRMLVLNGVNNKVRGDGDSHMRGMSCLLTGIELFPGNIMGGGGQPAGWASGISIDQEIKNHLQKSEDTRTRFGSLEFGVGVTDRADPWTRMSYAGANKPIAPISDPYQMYEKLYGQMKDKENLQSVLDTVKGDLQKVGKLISAVDRRLLEEHQALVRQMEKEIASASQKPLRAAPPTLNEGVADQNDNLPRLSRMQIDLLVNSFVNDMCRVATLQFTKSVGMARMNWLDIKDGHHSLSHEPDGNAEAVAKLTKINKWFAGELAYLVQKLSTTPEPGGEGMMLDHTLIVWTNELGKGNTHTLANIPFLLVGGAPGFKMGRSLQLENVAHNRLHLALAHALGHRLETFGKASLCDGGPLKLG
ncbi:MAG: hypothetical protein FD161_1354 [Limisphaerales bacterium]|nr:MAG: hypothetical protein FD161_1354 [Limisphaerales bacterium]KAG0509431.1 MAG: hypothetical protein E1N63_1273 [Limisphaerales bacterium]TXT52268.1 MAG: hypothetical protein FD140_755 [Limisphaerales bacterium]